MGTVTNIFKDGEISGFNPDIRGDTIKIADKETDHNYFQGKIADYIKALTNNPDKDFFILYGGEITDGGSGTINISAGAAIGNDSDGNVRFVQIPELTGVSLPSGWNDDRQIWVIGEHYFKLGTETRSHVTTAETYHYQLDDTYTGESSSDDLFVDSDPNTSESVVCWGSFKMNGTTFAEEEGRTRTFTIKTDEITGTDGGDVNLASIKHLIREFTVATGESVTAGQVVEYINGEIRGGVGGTLEYASEYDFETLLPGAVTSSLISENKIFIAYSQNNDFELTAIIATTDGTSIDFGDPVVITSNFALSYNFISCCTLEEDKVFVAYRDEGNSSRGTAVVGIIFGTVPSFGDPVVFEGGATNYISCCRVSENKVFIAYEDIGGSSYGTGIVGTISGTVPSFGSPVVFRSSSGTNYISCCTLEEDKVFIAVNDSTADDAYGIVGTISGTVPAFGGPVAYHTGSLNGAEYNACIAIDPNKVFIAYKNNDNSDYGTAIVGIIDGTVPEFGDPVVFESAVTTYISCCIIAKDKVLVTYKDEGNSSYGTAIIATINGTVPKFGDHVVYTGTNVVVYSSVIQIGENKACVSFSESTNGDGTSIILSESELLGISQEAASAGETAKIVMEGVSTAHTGLMDGMSYYADSDGNLLDPLLKIPGIYIGQALSPTELRLKF